MTLMRVLFSLAGSNEEEKSSRLTSKTNGMWIVQKCVQESLQFASHEARQQVFFGKCVQFSQNRYALQRFPAGGLTSVREEARVDAVEGLLRDEAAGAFRLEAAVDALHLGHAEARGLAENAQIFGSVAMRQLQILQDGLWGGEEKSRGEERS